MTHSRFENKQREVPRNNSIPTWIGAVLGSIILVLAVSFWTAKILARDPSEMAGWVQAIGAIVTIVTGVGIALWQQDHSASEKRASAREAAGAAHSLAFEALEIISERLEVALAPPKDPSFYALRGLRTTEMVTAMREVDTSRVPTNFLADFIKLRSQVYALNQRISELYDLENDPSTMVVELARQQRYEELASAVRTHRDAVSVFGSLQDIANGRHDIAKRSLTPRPLIAQYGS
jgi:hypothetical protein